MEKRLHMIAVTTLLSYVLIGLTHILKLSPTVALVAFVLAIAVLGSSIVNVVLAFKEGPKTRSFQLKRIIYQMLIAIVLVVIYMYRFNG